MAALVMPSPMGDGLPSSIHTEIAILGAMLLDAVAISDATAKLRAEDFSLDSHQRIYRTILDLLAVNHAVDFLTVQDALAKKRELEAIGGPAYLAYLTEGIPRNLNIESYVRIVKDKSLLRQLMSIFSEGMAQASDQTEEATKVLQEFRERFDELEQGALQSNRN
ncbi:MAG TPA: DnaB-like helicase N-terminal domain-containing protein, partial [Acidobacteriaceae bacterium]